MSKIINIPDPLQMLWNERYCHSSMIGECFGKVHSSTWVNMWRGLLQDRKSLEVWNRRYKSGKFMLTLYWTLMKEDIEPFFLKFIVYDWCCATVRPCFCASMPLMILTWTPWSLEVKLHQSIKSILATSSNGAGQHLVALMLEVRI